MQILKLDKTPIAPSQKLSLLYLATNGESPSENADKAVMINAINIDDALKSVKHKITREYLDTREPTLWRLGSMNREQMWVKIESDNDYYLEIMNESALSINKLKKAFQEEIASLAQDKVLKAIIKALYVNDVPSLRTAPAMYMLDKAFELSSNLESKVFFKKLADERLSRRNAFTLNSLKALLDDLVDRELVVSHKTDFVEQEQLSLNADSHSCLVIDYGTKQYPKFYYRVHTESDLPPLLEKPFELQKPLWRVKAGIKADYIYFTELNLAQSESFAEILATEGNSTIGNAIEKGILAKHNLTTIYDGKAHLDESVIKAISTLDVCFLNSESQWETFDASNLPTIGKLTEDQRQTYTLARKAALTHYGHTGLMGLFTHPLNRYAEPITNRIDLKNWVLWCDEKNPEFKSYDELKGKESKPYVQKRKRSVEVLCPVVRRHQSVERQGELELLFNLITPAFNKALNTAYSELNWVVDNVVHTAIFDTQNKFKEFYIEEELEGDKRLWSVEVNLGCHFNKVDIELNNEKPTIHYKNETLEVDTILNVEQYAHQKAIETIVEVLLKQPKEQIAIMLETAQLDRALINKKRLLTTAFVKKLMMVSIAA